MPSSMIFAGLVVIWLLILVPAVARHRQEVARPSPAALSGRVLERPRQRRDPEQARVPHPERGLEVHRGVEVDVMDQMDQQRSVAVVEDDRFDPDQDAPHGRPAGSHVHGHPDDHHHDHRDDLPDDHLDDHLDDSSDDHLARRRSDRPDDRGWERPPPRYRPGRGGFDPEAAELTARARYAFRQRVVLAMLLTAVVSGVVAAFAVPTLWWLHAAVDAALVGYLVYLRRQVRLEEAIRRRRAARMAGTRRLSAADDPELDEWARRGREAGRSPARHHDDPQDHHEPHDDLHADFDDDEPGHDAHDDVHSELLDVLDADRPDELSRERPERVQGTGESLAAASQPALPRLQPAPPPPLPAGTALVEMAEDDLELHGLDSPSRPDYRRAVGQ